MGSGGLAAGSSRALRLDPFSLPVRFAASDAAADERVRQVELHRERVVVRRAVRGMRMALNVPVSVFLGVALRIMPAEGERPASAAVVLQHRDPDLSLELFTASDSDDVMAEWRAWSRALGLPLLVADSDGSLREPFARLGSLQVEAPRPRRRRCSTLCKRRPSILMRRRPGRIADDTPVHRGEREIIARD